MSRGSPDAELHCEETFARSTPVHREREGAKSLKAPYLVGVGREEGQCCSQASLSSQEVGILAHLLGQKGPHGIRVHSLCELHGFAQDHDLLY